MNKDSINFIIFIAIIFVIIGVQHDSFAYNQHKLYTENKDYIVVLDAKVSNITEGWNPHVDDSDLNQYTIAVTYIYNGQPYVNNYLKQVTGDSYDDIYYKLGDTVEIVIFSHTPDTIVSDDPEDIEFYLSPPIYILPYCLSGGSIICIFLIIVCWLYQKIKRKIKYIK